MPLLGFPIATSKLRELISFPLRIQNRTMPVYRHDHFASDNTQMKVPPTLFCNRRLQLKDQLSQMPAAHPDTTRCPAEPPPPASAHRGLGRLLPSPHQGSTGLATTQLPVASAERSRVALSPRLYPVHFEKCYLCTQDSINPQNCSR